MAQGEFTFVSLPLGAGYSITAVKAGFAPAKLANIGIQRGSTAELTIRLDVAAGKTEQRARMLQKPGHLTIRMDVAAGKTEVTVTGVAEIRTDAPQLADRIVGRQLEETPLPSRKITYFPLTGAVDSVRDQGDESGIFGEFTAGFTLSDEFVAIGVYWREYR